MSKFVLNVPPTETRPWLRLSSGRLGKLGLKLKTLGHKASELFIFTTTRRLYMVMDLNGLHLHLKVEYRLSTLCTQLFSESINKPKQLKI